MSSLVIVRGVHTLSTCFSFQQRLALACPFDILISVVTLTFFKDLHTFSEFFAPQQVDLFSLSSPLSTYSLLCDMHAVACHHLKLLQEVHSTSSTCIFFQPRSVTVCFLVFKHMYSIDNHLFEDSYNFFLKFWPHGKWTTSL